MPNPFGGNDEVLAKNTSHPSQATLLYAFLPRTTTKWTEVITATDVTTAAGNYDADGYFFGANGTTVQVDLTISSLHAAQTITFIAAARYNSGGAANPTQVMGLQSTTSGNFYALLDRYNRRVQVQHYDSNSVTPGNNFSLIDPGNNDFSFSMRTEPGNQRAMSRIGVTTSTIGNSTDTLTGSATLNKLRVSVATLYGLRYIFVYSNYLGDAAIEYIMDAPGEVLSQAAGPVPKMGRCLYIMP